MTAKAAVPPGAPVQLRPGEWWEKFCAFSQVGSAVLPPSLKAVVVTTRLTAGGRAPCCASAGAGGEDPQPLPRNIKIGFIVKVLP